MKTTPRQFRITPERIAILDELAFRWSGKLQKATRTDVLNWLIDRAWETELKTRKRNAQRTPDLETRQCQRKNGPTQR